LLAAVLGTPHGQRTYSTPPLMMRHNMSGLDIHSKCNNSKTLTNNTTPAFDDVGSPFCAEAATNN
jgi:hypothetical protein